MATTDPAATLRPITTVLPTRRYLAEMWQRRDFAIAFPAEEVRAAHQDTLLGNLWHLTNPLLSVGVYYLVFDVVLNVSRGILWLSIGVFAFGMTNRCVLGGALSISGNQGLMRAIRFPRALLPLSVIVSRLITFGFELSVIAVLAVATGQGVGWRWLVLPLVVALHSALNLGGAFIAARLNDSFRDIQQIIPFVFRLLMYLSGVLIPIDRFVDSDRAGPVVRELVRLNPLAGLLDLYRWVFIESSSFTQAELVRVLVWAAVLLVFGFWFFRTAETRYGRS
jgi:teichoic acid transport system permease protein